MPRNIHKKQLKIRIETGNIFFNKLDTNESIYGLFQQQENQWKAKIIFEFSFTESYEGYFDRLVQGFKGSEDQKRYNKWKLKILICQFNDYLERLCQPMKHILHSVITDDDLALDIIQYEN